MIDNSSRGGIVRGGEVTSVGDLVSMSEEYGPNTIFRGENGSYPYLMPKIGRVTIRRDGHESVSNKNYFERIEIPLLSDFEDRALPYLSPELRGVFSWASDKLIIAQHYGLPTRLLDWTSSILVAAYFAVIRGKGNGRIFIYSFNEERVFYFATRFQAKRNLVVKPKSILCLPGYLRLSLELKPGRNQRLIYQLSNFLTCQLRPTSAVSSQTSSASGGRRAALDDRTPYSSKGIPYEDTNKTDRADGRY